MFINNLTVSEQNKYVGRQKHQTWQTNLHISLQRPILGSIRDETTRVHQLFTFVGI